MLEKKRSDTKNNFERRNFSKTSSQTVMFTMHILRCVSSNKYGYNGMKIIYREENRKTEIYKQSR